jgi:RsmE family RNA methyltransferase
MSYFYVKNIIENNESGLGMIVGKDCDHLLSVRIEKDEQVILTNLNGSKWTVTINFVNKKRKEITFSVIEFEYIKQNEFFKNYFQIDITKVLVQAQIDKSYLEKLVEILPFCPFNQIYFVKSDFSPNQNINKERLDKILIRSCEQSQSLYKPKLNFEFENIANILENTFKDFNKFYLHTEIIKSKQKELKKFENKNQLYIVGPEGGFSPREINLLNEKKIESIYLTHIIYPSWLCPIKIRI